MTSKDHLNGSPVKNLRPRVIQKGTFLQIVLLLSFSNSYVFLLLFSCAIKRKYKNDVSAQFLRLNYILIAITECSAIQIPLFALTKMLGKYNGLVVPKHLSFRVQVNPKVKQLDGEKSLKGTSRLQFCSLDLLSNYETTCILYIKFTTEDGCYIIENRLFKTQLIKTYFYLIELIKGHI